jgi:hypothetical protein
MFLELFVYEAVTTIGGLMGLKLLVDRKYLRGINQPKTTPMDAFVKRHVGKMSKTEDVLSRNTVKFIQHISRYQMFRYLLILAGRKVNENVKARSSRSVGGRFLSTAGISSKC